jgi:hypothetical protein
LPIEFSNAHSGRGVLNMRMRTSWIPGLCAVVVAGWLGGAGVASAGPGLTAGTQSFERFCSTWMGKLAERERHNLKTATPKKNGSGFLVEYTGYAKRPMRCEARETGVPSNPFIGKLVYHELRYQRAGATPERAHTADANVLEQVEVMEIFRFDGTKWVY